MSDLQHPGSRSFELVADLYERARPEYPAEAIAWMADRIDLREGRTVLDLGAGTGKLTRALVSTGAGVIAVEPGEAMLRELRRAVPAAQALHGAAEDIPLPDKSVDAITVGQAFHWFREDEALPEMHRVLRPHGALVLTWNERDHDTPMQREITELIAPCVPPGRPGSESWTKSFVDYTFAHENLFGPLEERRFPFAQELDAEGLVDRIGSISFVAAAAPELRSGLEGELRNLVARKGGKVELAYLTSVYISRAA